MAHLRYLDAGSPGGRLQPTAAVTDALVAATVLAVPVQKGHVPSRPRYSSAGHHGHSPRLPMAAVVSLGRQARSGVPDRPLAAVLPTRRVDTVAEGNGFLNPATENR